MCPESFRKLKYEDDQLNCLPGEISRQDVTWDAAEEVAPIDRQICIAVEERPVLYWDNVKTFSQGQHTEGGIAVLQEGRHTSQLVSGISIVCITPGFKSKTED